MNFKESLWEGFRRLDFTANEDREAIVVLPERMNEKKIFVFRAEFFGAFPSADIAMLEKGFPVAYIKNSNRYGCNGAVETMKDFQRLLEKEFGFRKAIMFGFSRGGLYSVNYAAKYPENIAALYLDAPVLNILSWPLCLGNGYGDGSDECAQQCLDCYGITMPQALSFRGNPIDKADILLENNIPIISVCGGSDTVVPFDENMEIFEKYYRSHGGNIKLIVKPKCGHHPHSLEDASPIVEFLLNNII